MTVDVTMPQLGETVSEGTVTRWLRQVGDVVNDNEPLLEISTDKVDTEVPSPASGTLVEILVAEDSTVPVGALLGRLRSPVRGDTSGARAPEPEPATVVATPGVPDRIRAHRHRHTPRVRHRATEWGVDLAAVVGTGPGGRVTVADLDRVEAEMGSAGAPATGVQQAFTAPVTASPAVDADAAPGQPRDPAGATTPQFTTVVEVDLTSVAALDVQIPVRLPDLLGGRLTLLAVTVRAAAQALGGEPPLRASAVSGQLGIAVDTGQELPVRLGHDARDLNVTGLARRIAAMMDTTTAATPTSAATGSPLFVVACSGGRQVLWDTPILGPGQAGVLSIGLVTERPVVVHDVDGGRSIAIRSVAYLSLTVDRRWLDAAGAARLVNEVKHRLETASVDTPLG